jgi:hypothetical protein
MNMQGVTLAEEELERLRHRIRWLETIRNSACIILPVALAAVLWKFGGAFAGISAAFHVAIIVALTAILVLIVELEIQIFKAELRELIRDIEHSFWNA